MNWTRDHSILALDLYCRLPFGKMHSRNPAIVSLARAMGRTAGSLAMKLSNYASFDPALQQRGIKGLGNASRADRAIWDEFEADWEKLALQGAELRAGLLLPAEPTDEPSLPTGETEIQRTVQVRRVQRFFRDAVMSSYDYSCAFCRLSVPALLVASHIIPWREDIKRRADPRNGLALCCLHDRAFDRALMTVDADHRIVVSQRLHTPHPPAIHQVGLLNLAGKPLHFPHRFRPAEEALAYHRQLFAQADTSFS